ncbi:PREDICTED: X-linked retinitis pigmentosa GTPase regulator [Wasmannia auropunctata]|uniref:X-linked retinitis pigmentosa GTPase regulator n=1 Tax=Wasmannia auropunctata TaxID=64793 RepID=UPI0005EDC74B|nr:PREDICTED: X-linked retinitis pigmentosa GTPase regulator [Wasmannia auropunctata]
MGLPDIETIPETGAVFTIGRSRFADNIASHFFIRKDPVVIIECGDEQSAVVCQTGRLFVFGSNDWGQLGLGHKNHISKPSCVKILKPERVTHVACGRAHTLICTGAQKIFACGSNQEGQLGRENSVIGDSSSSPILVYDCGLAGPRVVQLAAGSHHSMALTSDGGVVVWGSNLEGQLGLPGISGLVKKPTKVPIPEPVKEISAGYYHSVFLTESGLVYVCGESESGKLGINVNFSTQVAPKQMQLPSPALHVACGGHHTLVLAENGNIYCSGSNASGQLGMGTNVNEIHTPKLLPRGALQNEKIVKIACGESHSAILTESGKLFTCGDGRHGKLGLEENENNVHEVTFAAKYQELFISNVACGGCHTILVGRRHEIDYQSQRQPDSEQKKSSLPPLKLPVNMQNEHRVDSTEKSTDEKDDSYHPDESSETSNNGTQINSSPKEDSLKENTDIVNNEEISSLVNDEKTASPSSEINLSENSQEKDQIDHEDHDTENNTESKENSESKDINENNENEENNKNMEIATIEEQDVEESCAEKELPRIEEEEGEKTTNSVPPPKPPRLKSGSVEGTNNEIESSKENEEGEQERDDEEMTNNKQNSSAKTAVKSLSAISKKTVEAIENSIEKVEEDERPEEVEKTEIDGTQDDADVVQSPAPRTAKMAKLFKGKRQEVQNGTKTSSATNPKAKSKTCTIL